MSTRDLTVRQKAAALVVVTALLATLVDVGLLLQEHGLGNVGTGFLQPGSAKSLRVLTGS